MATIGSTRRPPEGWSFTVKEVSAGMYQIRAESPDGLVMLRGGPDEIAALSKLVEDAWKLSA
jgi:hypothetical protein